MTESVNPETQASEPERVFLVVADESEEMANALRFACRRAEHTNGRVALLHVIEPVEFQHWLGVGRVMEQEARTDAEMRMQKLSSSVFEQTGKMPAVHIQEGDKGDELIKLLNEDPSISLLVLATASNANNPGPLVSHLLSNLGRRVRIPVTLVPGELSVDEIDGLT